VLARCFNDPAPAEREHGDPLMTKKFFIAWIAMFVAWMAESFVVHAALLGADYAKLPNLFRPEADSQQYFGWMLLAHVLIAGAFVWIYARGVEAGKPWLAQGTRFGLAVALLGVVPTYLIYYAVQPMPGALVAKQVVFDGVGLILMGIVVAWFYRSRSESDNMRR
jgi:hypothetical protein